MTTRDLLCSADDTRHDDTLKRLHGLVTVQDMINKDIFAYAFREMEAK